MAKLAYGSGRANFERDLVFNLDVPGTCITYRIRFSIVFCTRTVSSFAYFSHHFVGCHVSCIIKSCLIMIQICKMP